VSAYDPPEGGFPWSISGYPSDAVVDIVGYDGYCGCGASFHSPQGLTSDELRVLIRDWHSEHLLAHGSSDGRGA
jgi:hypothetical protein